MPKSINYQRNNSNSGNCRKKLQKNFDECLNLNTKRDNCNSTSTYERNIISMLTINENTRKAIRNGVERLNRTFNSIRTTMGTVSQKFKTVTKRRQILDEGPMTPYTSSKHVLGRTPTKLYSPFGIETPKDEILKKN